MPPGEANFDLLLGEAAFVVVRDQLIFRYEGQVMVTQISPHFRYTAEDYFKLPEGAPYQLIQGNLVFIASPQDVHQMVLGNLHFLIKQYLKQERSGIVRFAPLDVELDKDNVFQPDLLFIRNQRRGILTKRVKGAPDFVVEILSPGSSSHKDRNDKKAVYGQHGVEEYWIIDPERQRLEIYLNREGELLPEQTVTGGEVKATVIAGLRFELGELWEE
jgi:Uma2 family endonuclease